MGIFDFLKKDNGGNKIVNDRSMFTELTQTVALTMMQYKITKQPAMQFLREDAGILNTLAEIELNDNKILAIKRQDPDTFMFVLAAHAFGAGVYSVLMQSRFDKPVGDFDESELAQIFGAFKMTDAYELALNCLGFDVNGNNKKVIDNIILTCIQQEKNLSGSSYLDESNLKAMMQVMFNAGVTLLMREP